MKNRYRKFRRGKIWWCHDSQTGKQSTLKTKSKPDACRMLDLMNQPYQNADFHLEMARTHLKQGDVKRITRTWQHVFDAIIEGRNGSTRQRWERAAKDKAFASILNRVVVETSADDFLAVLKAGGVATNEFLKRLHNYAFGMNWLLMPIIPKKAWPKAKLGEKRAVTLAEHQQILAREKNPERKAYYEVCWHVGGAQSDMANLKAEDIDWQRRTISYNRKKTGQPSTLVIGSELEKVLRALPATGKLFPYLAGVRVADRATEFRQRCKGLGIEGVSLHSYRYAWAERAVAAGYPERYAQKALGHGSKAVARAYARNAEVLLPSLENYEQRHMLPQVQNN